MNSGKRYGVRSDDLGGHCNAAENFDKFMYRNLQPHRAVLPAIARHLVIIINSVKAYGIRSDDLCGHCNGADQQDGTAGAETDG